MAAFTEEQLKIIEIAFDHMWRRMETLHDELNDDSTRIIALGGLLIKQKLLTIEQWNAAKSYIEMEAKESRAIRQKSDRTEEETTRHILRGGMWEG